MARLSDASIRKLMTCDPKLQLVVNEVIQIADFSIISGYRGFEEQADLFRQGASQKAPGKSKHNMQPSQAFDFIPYPFQETDWKKLSQFSYLGGLFIATGRMLGVKLRWGYDWNMNGDTRDERFIDAGHIELID